MYIKTSHDHLQELKNSHTLGERVEFSSTNTAQVAEDVGESVLDHYDTDTFWEKQA